ncbi:MAG: hypothetical protein KME21_29070 [Desmonostoc vinosum HA7617-LM4]|jgi:hypothetical protein|nr:hypothetical protein [Desmonostoc vinosum HA7617-LM4]
MTETLTFKYNPIVVQKIYEGREVIITYCQPNPYDVGHYFWYVRNSDLEVLADNSKGYGCSTDEEAIATAILAVDELI